MLHYPNGKTSILQQESIIYTHNLLHKSIHQTSTKDLLFHLQTLTNNASTSSLLNMHKPIQDLNPVYILKIRCHPHPYPHLKPQKTLIVPTPTSVVELIDNICTNSTTSYHGDTTDSNQQRYDTRQHTQPRPLHHLPIPTFTVVRKDNLIYHLNTSISTCNIITYADDLAIITDNSTNITTNLKLQKNLERTHLDLKLTKCAITKSPNKSKLKLYSKPTYKPKLSY